MRNRSIVVMLVMLVLLAACRPEAPTEPTEPPKVEEQESVVAETVEAKKERPPLVVPDRLFGLPVPGSVISVMKAPDKTTVVTEWNLDQVERFFAKQLVDYEVIREDSQLLVVGLREYMSHASALKTSRKQKTVTVTYYDGKPEPTAKKVEKPKKGAPVELTTRTGDLLAPGARWYEPYTPPPGSPLDKPRYKGNFGTPFGKWVDN